ncbi:hypothetical protein [Lentilactobacillus kosonis]|uniref:Uncharacterized protein n=1 Tax=Lentilactobacillus kosonis TaxID=2810561 RepID=A0A401FM73_9LACO|nr:hypothetical protein [Lentilactobacillus kosonis]GAY73489.1 hypothetical protein NBRC111893_1635 [Lentilactobacillus kosonis]
MTKKGRFNLPQWIKNTLQVVVLMGILMAAYNFFGPTINPNGTYFAWWTFPYSMLAALLIVGAWNFLKYRMDLLRQEIKREDAEKERQRQLRQQQAAVDDVVEAQKRRARNHSKQQQSR